MPCFLVNSAESRVDNLTSISSPHASGQNAATLSNIEAWSYPWWWWCWWCWWCWWPVLMVFKRRLVQVWPAAGRRASSHLLTGTSGVFSFALLPCFQARPRARERALHCPQLYTALAAWTMFIEHALYSTSLQKSREGQLQCTALHC